MDRSLAKPQKPHLAIVPKMAWNRISRRRRCALAAILMVALVPARAQEVTNRLSLLVDTSSRMLLTPEVITFAESCASTGFDACTFSGNPTIAQESCNACVAGTVRFNSACASNWTATCRTQYTQCVLAVTGADTCRQSLNISDGITTRGDGSSWTPGCDLNGNSLPDDSRLFRVKTALGNMIAQAPAIETSLWRMAQVTGGQSCSSPTDCPQTPGALSVLSCNSVQTVNRCNLNASSLDVSATSAGQCSPGTWNGAESDFSCGGCDDGGSNERTVCDAYDLDRVRTGGTSPLNNASAVSCGLPTTSHPFMKYAGAVRNGEVCDPVGADRLVDFPAPGNSNQAELLEWLDHQLLAFASDNELTANGAAPLGGMLREFKSQLLVTLSADVDAACRQYEAVVIAAGSEECESIADAVAAASALQSLSFTDGLGHPISNYSVRVHVIAFGVCPTSEPNCSNYADLSAIAQAGNTLLISVATAAELQLALESIASGLVPSHCVEPWFSDGFEQALALPP